MKLQKNNIGHFAGFIIAGAIIGSLVWDLLELFLSLSGITVSFQVGPVGFDLTVLSLYMTINPGTIAGIIAGIILFRSL